MSDRSSKTSEPKSRGARFTNIDDSKKDRLPPHAIEVEQGDLGCILISPNDCMGQCLAALKAGPDTFYDLRHQAIYQALAEMFDKREPIDTVTLFQKLKDNKLIVEVGGLQYITSVPDIVPSAANLAWYL